MNSGRNSGSWVYAVLAAVLMSSRAVAHAPPARDAPPPPPVAAQAPSGADVAEPLRARFLRAASLFDAKEYEAADALLRPMPEEPDFATLPEQMQMATYALSGGVALLAHDIERAMAMFEKANASPAADVGVAVATLDLAVELWRPGSAILPMRVLAAQAPEKLRALEDAAMFQLDAAARHANLPRGDRIQLLGALFDVDRVLADGRQPSGLWLDLSRLHLENGDLATATTVARRVVGPHGVLAMQVDRRFDEVVKALDPAQLDVSAAMDLDLRLLVAAVESEPRKVGHVVALTYTLLDAGRFADALAACDAALAKSAAAQAEPAFDDEHEQLVWVHDNRARALLGLGRIDDAIAVWEPARQMPENGGTNVSQAINLAALYGALGRQSEALAALETIGAASPFGWMQYHSARAVALLASPQDPRGVESLAYAREHRSDASGTYMWLLLKTGAIDEAAVVLQERLADPDERAAALLDVQVYSTRPISTLNATWMERMRGIVARPEVVKAIEAVGRVKTVPLFNYPL